MHGASYMTIKFPKCTQCGAEHGSPEQWNSRRPDAETLRADVLRLHKIAAYVPAKVYIEAKERAGFGVQVKANESGAWKNLRCDVCGCTFEGFHALNAAGDRCCPKCAEQTA